MTIFVIIFIIFICLIIVNLILYNILSNTQHTQNTKNTQNPQNTQNLYDGKGELHWLDEPMNKKVKNSLLLYIKTSLKPIIKKNPSILSIFTQCINNTHNRKIYLTQLRKKLSQTKLCNSNAGRNEKWRCENRTANLKQMLNNLSNNKKQILQGPYLDIGCGDGSITESVYINLINNPANLINNSTHSPANNKIHKKCDDPNNCNNNQAYCLEYGDEKPGFSKLVTRETDIKKLKSNYFNTISAFMSLHHIPTIESMMHEIGRISKVGAIFILRDHDFTYCVSNFDSKRDTRQFLDWIHVLYNLAESSESLDSVDWLYNIPRTDIVYQYQPMIYWDKLLKNIGFERISNIWDKKSLICSYYTIYKKMK
jgi:hypothetical protein